VAALPPHIILLGRQKKQNCEAKFFNNSTSIEYNNLSSANVVKY
jgi:hypothetical protein